MLAAGFSQAHQSKFPTQAIPVPTEYGSGLEFPSFKKSIDVIVSLHCSWVAQREVQTLQR
jgi:hypothetical protein